MKESIELAAATLNTQNVLQNPFIFSNHDVRTAVDDDGEVWFCAKDVCESIGIAWKGAASTLPNIDEDWVKPLLNETPKGVQRLLFIAEPAIYGLVCRSNKPAARAFQRWLFTEVLPAIRKNGFYGQVLDSKTRMAYARQISTVTQKLIETRDAFLFAMLQQELRQLCNLTGQKMPSMELIGQDPRQPSLPGVDTGRKP